MNNIKKEKSTWRKIDFVGKAPLFSSISVLAVIASAVFLLIHGVNYGIDFAGGIEVQVKFARVMSIAEVRQFADKMSGRSVSLQKLDDGSEFLLRFQNADGKTEKEINENIEKLIDQVTEGLTQTFAEEKPEIRRVDSVGPQIGEELKRNSLLAGFYSLLLILIYIGLRFDYRFAPGAVICLFHDVMVTLGIFMLCNHEVNVQTLAAILTIIGYSLNDTIINYDRIRENMGVLRGADWKTIINTSVNEMLSRTILTSFTTLLAVFALYFLATGVIVDLAFTLGIGIVVGTYSSIYVAAPLIIVFDKLKGLIGQKA